MNVNGSNRDFGAPPVQPGVRDIPPPPALPVASDIYDPVTGAVVQDTGNLFPSVPQP